MADAVARGMPRSAREIRVGDCKFDVVSYDKKEKLFRLVECKLGSKAATIGHAFGQVAAYYAVLSTKGRAFLDAFSKRVPLRYRRMMEATNENRRIRVAFYVALTDKACKHVDLIGAVKTLLPSVGILRVKPDGKCRAYLRRNGKKDFKLAEARPMTVEVLQETVPNKGASRR